MTKELAISDRVAQLDEIAQTYSIQEADKSPFASAFKLAQAMKDIRSLLTPDMMAPIMGLMNTDLGFRTDKDPHQIDSKTGKPHVGYSEAAVKDVMIEGILRGFYPVGNEINIIAGRFYATKNGLRRKVTTYPGVTDFKDTYEVPRMSGDKGAVVKARATWFVQKVANVLEREIPVRVNAMMGSDAILGKAERKLLKSVFDRLNGISTPEGEVGEETPEVPEKRFNAAKPVFEKPETVVTFTKPETKADSINGQALHPVDDRTPEDKERDEEFAQLTAFMAEHGITEDEIMAFFKSDKIITRSTSLKFEEFAVNIYKQANAIHSRILDGVMAMREPKE